MVIVTLQGKCETSNIFMKQQFYSFSIDIDINSCMKNSFFNKNIKMPKLPRLPLCYILFVQYYTSQTVAISKNTKRPILSWRVNW